MEENPMDKEIILSEKPAVKTTIVGGRPPGCGKDVDSVPRGIEILVKKASVDHAFREVLLKERAAAANRISLSLDDTETVMLNNIPQSHLEGIISATKVSPNMKQVFLGYTAAVMLAALTATANAADYDDLMRQRGTRYKNTDFANSRGIRPDAVEYNKDTVAYFNKAESEARLETGILEAKITDKISNLPLNSIKVYFLKKDNSETNGLGYTDALGIYRIEGLPIGTYYITVAKDSKYFVQSKELEINANKENAINFQLVRTDQVATEGMRPDYPEDY